MTVFIFLPPFFVTYYLGYFGSIQPKVLVSTGFDAIAVSLLGNSNPIGILFSSFFISNIPYEILSIKTYIVNNKNRE